MTGTLGTGVRSSLLRITSIAPSAPARVLSRLARRLDNPFCVPARRQVIRKRPEPHPRLRACFTRDLGRPLPRRTPFFSLSQRLPLDRIGLRQYLHTSSLALNLAECQ